MKIPIRHLTAGLCLMLVLLLLMNACTTSPVTPPSPDGESPDSGQTPEDPSKPAESQIDLLIGKTTDYTIVYDGRDDHITAAARDIVTLLNNTYGTEITAVPATEAKTDYGHEIVIGQVRPAADAVREQLGQSDFGLCVVEDDYVLLATGSRLYEYLFAVLRDIILPQSTKEGLTLHSKDNFIYSNSSLSGKSYIEYRKQKDHLDVNAIREQLFEEIFEYRTYEATNTTVLPYRLYVPHSYDRTKEYPVLLVLHGAGERGTDNQKHLLHLLPDLFALTNCPVTEAIIVAPQCPEDRRWVETDWSVPTYSTENVPESPQLEAVMELLDELGAEFSVDMDRYYVTGLSMGGFGTWDLISRHTDWFAAAVPICGGADLSCAEQLVDFPIHTVHDAGDTIVPPAGTQQMVAAIRDAGGETIFYDEKEGYGHGVWGWVGQQQNIWTWLFDQSLSDR